MESIVIGLNERNSSIDKRRPTAIPRQAPSSSSMYRLYKQRPHRFTILLVGLISIVMVFCIGWGACTIERRLVDTAGHSLVQTASDAASKLETMIADSSFRQEGRLNLRDMELPSARLVAASE